MNQAKWPELARLTFLKSQIFMNSPAEIARTCTLVQIWQLEPIYHPLKPWNFRGSYMTPTQRMHKLVLGENSSQIFHATISLKFHLSAKCVAFEWSLINPPKTTPQKLCSTNVSLNQWASPTKLKKRCAMRGFKLDTNCTEASKRPTAKTVVVRPRGAGSEKKTEGRPVKDPKKISKIGLLNLWSWGNSPAAKRLDES